MKQSEQRLLAIFLLALVAAVTWVGWKRLREAEAGMRAEAAAMVRESELAQRSVDAYADEMAGADKWMNERMGEPVSPQEGDTRLLRAVQESARTAGLQLTNEKFLPPHERGKLRLARYTATVTGSEGDIYPWLASFHSPDKLRAVLGVTIRPDKEDETIVICEVEFAQWYLPAQEEEQT